MGKGQNPGQKKAKGGGSSSIPNSGVPPEKAIVKPNPASKGKKKRSEIDDIFGLASEAGAAATNAEEGSREPLSSELKEVADQIKRARDTKAAVSTMLVDLGSSCLGCSCLGAWQYRYGIQ